MTTPAYIAIDLGAESGRAVVGSVEDERLTLEEVHRFYHLPQRLPSGLHWDLTGLWREVLEGARRGGAYLSAQGFTSMSLGVDTWGVDYALIGESGELLGMPHCYRDERNRAAFERAMSIVGPEAVYEATGIQFMPLNTLYQLMAQYEAAPSTLEQAKSLLFMPDLMHYLLTGQMVTESTIASTSQMIDPRTGQWATGLLDRLNLPIHFLQEPAPPAAQVGRVTPHVEAELGPGLELQVIAPAAHDTASAVAAVPAVAGSNWCYLSSGTWSLLGAELEQPCITAEAREASFTNERGVGGTIRFLKNITGLWLIQECRRAFEAQGKSLEYEELTEAASEAEPFRTLADTAHEPFASAGSMPAKIASCARETGQPAPETIGQFARCCFESLALTYRHTLENMERILDLQFDVLHIVGGGGRNQLLNQMAADALGRRVVVGPFEATAAGNVLVQALGAGAVRDLSHIRRIVAESFELETLEPRNTATWDQAYARFLELLNRSSGT